MKKPYSKPTITVGAIQLDQPIAVGCTADFEDMRSLLELGYFTAEGACASPIPGEGPIQGHDTICYHSNVQTAFTS